MDVTCNYFNYQGILVYFILWRFDGDVLLASRDSISQSPAVVIEKGGKYDICIMCT